MIKISKNELLDAYEKYREEKESNYFDFKNNKINKEDFVDSLLSSYLYNKDELIINTSSFSVFEKTNNDLIDDLNYFLFKEDLSNMSNTSGMGPVVAAQPGSQPGEPGTIGSGDISGGIRPYSKLFHLNPLKNKKFCFYCNNKKKNRKKKILNPFLLESSENEIYYESNNYENEEQDDQTKKKFNFDNFEEIKEYLSSLSERISEFSYSILEEFLKWLFSINKNRDDYKKVEILDIRPSYGALSNKGIYLELDVFGNIFYINISPKEEEYIHFKIKREGYETEEFEKKGDLKYLTDHIKFFL